MKRSKQTLKIAGMILALFLIWGTAHAKVILQCPADTDGVDTDGDGIVDNDVVCLHMGAGDGYIQMADGEPMYIFSFSRLMDGSTMIDGDTALMQGMLAAEFPAPTMVFKEGQNVYLNLTNVGMVVRPDLFDPHSVHFHGFPQAAAIFDGVPDASATIAMQNTFTYYYSIVEPGTFIWHCHVEATEHMEMGMLGQVYVLPIQNNFPAGTDLNGFIHQTGFKYAYNDGDGSTRYDVEYPLQLGSMDPAFHMASESVQPLNFALLDDKYSVINGRGYPDTVNPGPLVNINGNNSQPLNSIVEANWGEVILLRLSSLSVTKYFTVTTPGVPMKVVGRGARLLRGPDGKDLTYTTSHVILGGGEAMDVLIDTSLVPPGTYFLHTSNLNYLSNDQEDNGGMMTEIRINP